MSRSSKQALIGLGSLAVVLIAVAVIASAGNRAQGLRADVLSARRTEPGRAETFTVSVRDTAGKVQSIEVDFGDGRVEELEVPDGPCRSPLSSSFDVEHAFDFTGYSTVIASVVTGGCGASTERVEAIRTIQVKAVREP